MRDYTPDPRLYEMMTILSPDVSEDDLPAQIETIAGYITTAGGTVNETLRESPWGRRRLAYSIRHTGRDIRDGFYTVFHFTLDPGGVRDIERDLKLNDQVMRFLITHYTPKPEVPGAPAAVGEEASADGETATTDAAAPESGAPAETAVVAEAASETADATVAEAPADTAPEAEVEAAAPEAAEPVEDVADVAAPAEVSDTEAASAAAESAEDAAASETPVEEVAADEPVADEPANEEPASEETPAEPTAPAKDDEEA